MSDDVPPDAQAEIALAVRNALAQHGYERLTTAKIAAELDMSESGLYYYYESKDEMIAAFLDHAAGQLGEMLADTGSDDHEANLRAACDHLFLSPEDPDAGVHVAIMELLSHAPYNETLREPLLELEWATLNVLEDIVREGVEDGVFREVDPEATAAFLLAAADGSTGFHVALGMEVGDSLDAGTDAYVDMLLSSDAD